LIVHRHNQLGFNILYVMDPDPHWFLLAGSGLYWECGTGSGSRWTKKIYRIVLFRSADVLVWGLEAWTNELYRQQSKRSSSKKIDL
jgi:hypothetical protein